MPGQTRAKAVAAILVLALLTVFTLQNRATVSLDELEQRIEVSAPQWANYQEDIKAHIGATPTAEWEGKPVSARIDRGILYIDFELEGPWASRGLALPLLAHDPLGNTYQNTSAEFDGARVTYIFALAEEAARAALPWAELKYPHHDRRLVFSDAGIWEAPS